MTPKADSGLAAYWRSATERLETDLYRERAAIRLSPQGVSLLLILSPAFVHAGIELSDEADAEGWRIATLPVKDAAIELLRFGADAEVLEPAGLRAEIFRIAEQMT